MNCQEFWNHGSDLAKLPAGNLSGLEMPGEKHPHLAECPACVARVARYQALHAGFRALAAGVRPAEAPARVESRLVAEFRRQTGASYGGAPRRWVPLVTWAAALAAMITLAFFLVRPNEPKVARPPARHQVELALLQPPQADSEGFIPLPNTPGVEADGDEVNLVRMEVPRSAMIALGIEVSEDRASELVEADVMLGSNGVARAVRFLD